MSQFVFVQWVAPFLSEFPEKVSAFHWASRVRTAPMALDEHGVEQHQSVDRARGDDPDRVLALARRAVGAALRRRAARTRSCSRCSQSAVAVLLLLNMSFEWWDAALLFVLWLAQFLMADWRDEIRDLYAVWAVLLDRAGCGGRRRRPAIFWRLLARKERRGECRRNEKTSPAGWAGLAK